MVKKLSNTLVAMFRNLFESKSATEQYLAQSTDICDLESKQKETLIGYKTKIGKIVPEGANKVWPFAYNGS